MSHDVYLNKTRAPMPDDGRVFAEWLLDAPFMQFGRRPVTPAEAYALWTGDALAVLVWADPEPKCVAGLYGVSWENRKAELRVLVDPQARGKGYAKRTMAALLALGTLQYGLHRIWLGTARANVQAIAAFMSVGFVKEGVLYDDVYLNGEWHDTVRMAFLWSVTERRP